MTNADKHVDSAMAALNSMQNGKDLERKFNEFGKQVDAIDADARSYPALADAYDALMQLDPSLPVSVRHVLLLTDGKSDPGDFAGIVRKLRDAKISLSTIGIDHEHQRADRHHTGCRRLQFDRQEAFEF